MPCQFTMVNTGEKGFDTGRPRYLVTCDTCSVVLHEATTGPAERINQHLRDIRDAMAPVCTAALVCLVNQRALEAGLAIDRAVVDQDIETFRSAVEAYERVKKETP